MTLRSALISGLLFSTISSAAFAQAGSTQVSNTAVTKLDAIVVTATRTERRNLDALAAIDVLDTTDIARIQARNGAELVDGLPNVNLQAGPRHSISQINMRGLDDRRVVMKVDGVNRNFRGEYKGRAFFNPTVLKRVEVAKGGNSVLDGSGALAGTVEFVTKDAADYLDAGQNVGATVEASGATNGAMVGGNVAVYGRNEKLDVLAFHETTTSGNISLGDNEELPLSELLTRQNLVKATWKATEDLAVTAKVTDYFDQGDSLSNPIRDIAEIGNYATNRRAHQTVGDLKAVYTPLDNDMVNLTALASLGNTEVTEVVLRNPGVPAATIGRRDTTTYDESSLELYNTSNISGEYADHAVTVGGLTTKNEQNGSRPGTLRAGLYPDADSTNYAVYAQDEISVGRWTFVPGARWESYELSSPRSAVKNSGDQLVGKFSAGYKINPNTQAYASVSQGYRSPTMFESYASGNLGGPTRVLDANPNLKPEESTNFELGLKSDLTPNVVANDKLTVTASVFRNDLKNLIERQQVGFTPAPPFPVTRFGYVNVDEAYTYGVEVGMAYTTPVWFGEVNAGYTRGENETQNQPLLDIPPLEANAKVGRHGVTTDGGVWRAAYTVKGAMSQQRIPANDLFVTASDDYVLHGVQAEYEPSWTVPGSRKTTFRVSADNLFNQTYRPVTNFIDGTGLDVRGAISVKF